VCEISANSSMPSSGSPVNCGMDIAGTGFLTTFTYNLASHTTTITQGAQTRTFQTDAAGRTIYTNEPERGVTTYSYTYNSTGLVVVRTRPKANQNSPTVTTTTTTQYDSVGRQVSISYSDTTPTKQFQYDQAGTSPFAFGSSTGLLTTANTLQGSSVVSATQLGYDISGNVITTSQCVPGRCGNTTFNVLRYYQYDPVLGTRMQESYLAGGSTGTRVDTNMTYTVAAETLTMTNTQYGSILTNMQNTAYGPASYKLGNGLNGVRSYDGLGRGSATYVCANSTSANCTGGTQSYGMTQTVQGSRVTAMTDSVNGSATPGYDEFNRLSSINYPSRGQAFSYTYDRYGNRWNQTVTQGSGPSPQLSFNVTYNQLVSTGYSYDAAGNLLTDGTHHYAYDAEGNLIQVDNGTTATYAYDALNHRVRETIGSSDTDYTFNTDGQRVATWSATSPTPTLLAAYAYWNGTPITTYSSAGTFYSHQDLLGTKRLTTTSSGAVAGTYQSLPFGDGYTPTGIDPDASHFALLDRDGESSTEHAQFRQHAPTSATWMSPDPYDGSYNLGNPQSLNRYVYVMNNPLSVNDPSGLDGWVSVCVNPAAPPAGAMSGPQSANCSVIWASQDVTVYPGPDLPCYEDASCVQTQQSPPAQLPSNPYGSGSGGSGGSGGSRGSAGGAPSNGMPKPKPTPSQCAQRALRKNAVALTLDAAGFGAGFLPGGDLVVAGVQAGVSVASGVNSAVSGDAFGTVSGVLGLPASFAGYGAKFVGVGAKAIPGIGSAISAFGFLNDAYGASQDYQACLAGH
jgi:RHS repeat-associated protein